jgi:hypothetical protein
MLDSSSVWYGLMVIRYNRKIKAITNLGKQPIQDIEDFNYGISSVFKLATLTSLLEDKYVDKTQWWTAKVV